VYVPRKRFSALIPTVHRLDLDHVLAVWIPLGSTCGFDLVRCVGRAQAHELSGIPFLVLFPPLQLLPQEYVRTVQPIACNKPQIDSWLCSSLRALPLTKWGGGGWEFGRGYPVL